MPMINGRYYMNPQYGAALVRARAADDESVRLNGAPQPSWLDHFLGLFPSADEQEQLNQRDSNSSDIFREISESGDPDELEAQNRNNEETQQKQTQNTSQQTPQNIAATAGKYNGSTDWAFTAQKGAFARNTNKCNAFVGDVTKEAGAPASVTGRDGKSRYPLAAEWADKNTKIAYWRVLGKDETPQAGDVAAYKLPGGGTSFSGHSGIVTSVDRNGTVHGMAAHADVVGPDDNFQSGRQHDKLPDVVFRRYVGGQ